MPSTRGEVQVQATWQQDPLAVTITPELGYSNRDRVRDRGDMLPFQLDLFDASGSAIAPPTPSQPPRPRCPVHEVDDETLIAAIPYASLAECRDVAREVARRGLIAAVAPLEQLCRRFKGFGLHYVVPEQIAVLRALVAIGGREATNATVRLIVEDVVGGPGLAQAVSAAASLRACLPSDRTLVLLRHAEPAIRADACRCAPRKQAVIDVLIGLLDDLNPEVADAAACALGQFGRAEGRPRLTRLLREEPTPSVIAACAAVADLNLTVELGRIARTRPELAEAACAALEEIDDPRAAAILASVAA